MWAVGDVSGEEGGVKVAMLGADLAARSFAAPKNDVLDERRAPDSSRASVAMSSDDAQDTSDRPQWGFGRPRCWGHLGHLPRRRGRRLRKKRTQTRSRAIALSHTGHLDSVGHRGPPMARL